MCGEKSLLLEIKIVKVMRSVVLEATFKNLLLIYRNHQSAIYTDRLRFYTAAADAGKWFGRWFMIYEICFLRSGVL